MATIDEVFAEFLNDQRALLSDRAYQEYEQAVELFATSMNGYAANGLNEEDFGRWAERFEVDEHGAFTSLFGPDKIPENLGEFLDYFIIRKVMAGDDLIQATGNVTKKLAEWLGDNGHLNSSSAAAMADHGSAAATNLPAMNELAKLLYAETSKVPEFDAARVPGHHWLDDSLTIAKVEPGKLWFDGLDAPMLVSQQTSEAASVGWSVNVEAVKLNGVWRPVEVGNVYP